MALGAVALIRSAGARRMRRNRRPEVFGLCFFVVLLLGDEYGIYPKYIYSYPQKSTEITACIHIHNYTYT
jgi:hypothetical protein